MKKITAILLILILSLALCLFGCGEQKEVPAGETEVSETKESGTADPDDLPINLTEAALPYAATVMIDPELVEVDEFSIAAKSGNWTITVHICDSEEDLAQYQGYYENALEAEANSDVKTEEKTLGDYVYKTETHTANGQYFGTYFTTLNEPVSFGEDKACHGIYCYIWLDEITDENLAEIDSVINTLEIRTDIVPPTADSETTVADETSSQADDAA